MKFKKKRKLSLNRISIAQLDTAQIFGGNAEQNPPPAYFMGIAEASVKCVTLFIPTCQIIETEVYCL